MTHEYHGLLGFLQRRLDNSDAVRQLEAENSGLRERLKTAEARAEKQAGFYSRTASQLDKTLAELTDARQVIERMELETKPPHYDDLLRAAKAWSEWQRRDDPRLQPEPVRDLHEAVDRIEREENDR